MVVSLPAGAFGITKEYRERWGKDAFRALSSVAFKEADADASGFINLTELRTTLAKVRVTITEDEAVEVIEYCARPAVREPSVREPHSNFR